MNLGMEIDIDQIMATNVQQVKRESYTFKRKKTVLQENVNDGYCDSLGIWKPKPSISEIPDWIKSDWFRDPNSKQWISKIQFK